MKMSVASSFHSLLADDEIYPVNSLGSVSRPVGSSAERRLDCASWSMVDHAVKDVGVEEGHHGEEGNAASVDP